MLFNVPLSAAKAERLIASLDVKEGAAVADFGCGKGDFLVQLAERVPVRALGVDINETCILAARTEAERREVARHCEFRQAPVAELDLAAGLLDIAVCMGSTHAFASGEPAFENTLAALSRWVRPGGLILVGEGYWKRDPDPGYLDVIGEPVGIYRDHRGNIAFAEARGLVPLLAWVSNEDEWDDFEWSHQMQIETQASRNPGDGDLQQKLARRRRWRDAYLRWGRSTMGFGFYLLQRPGT